MSINQISHNANNRNMLEKANRLINDDVPTVALFTDPNDDVFDIPISKISYSKEELKQILFFTTAPINDIITNLK